MFDGLKLQLTPRKYQAEILDLVRRKAAEGKRRFHIVAPPGSGKTIVGLELALRFNRPALVLAPNSNIQSQWVDKLRHFTPPGSAVDLGAVASGDPDALRPLMALTYQSLTTRARADRAADSPAHTRWARQIVSDGEAPTEEEALALIHRMKTANPDLYEKRLAAQERALIAELTKPEDTFRFLHPNALALVDRLVEQDTGTVVLDECHHLTGYWARVAQAIAARLRDPVIVGLTATPPEDADAAEDGEANDYLELVGPIDYRVPTPAVIREGHLAPFQDLVYFCRPEPAELSFVAKADAEIAAVWRELEGPPNRLAEWVTRELATRPTPSGQTQEWAVYLESRRTFCAACREYLAGRKLPFPEEIRGALPARPLAPGEGRMIILERFVNRCLDLSSNEADHALAERIRRSGRLAGYQITGRGLRPCESPVSRVMSRSRAKAKALAPILAAEARALGQDLRAVVITDFERSAATRSDDPDGLIDEEAGGAVQAFREIARHPDTDPLDPILVTGQTVLVDDDLLPKYLEAARRWLAKKKLDVALETRPAGGFSEILGKGADWNTSSYVLMMTEFLSSGLTRCLVGTRGLLGEGWDCQAVNCLVDLTSAATAMTVRQLRGRSIRLDPGRPRKVANNWDVVCMAPEFQRGLSDYERFALKHSRFHSLTDDGQIEKGAHHVHPALRGARPEDVALVTQVFNAEMIGRAARRDSVYDKWGIGQPYENEEVATAQIHGGGGAPLCCGPGETALMSGDETIAKIAMALLEALHAAGEIEGGGAKVVVRSQSGGYCRAFLRGAAARDMAVFATALAEMFAPLDQQRYMAPRFVDLRAQTWLSRMFPEWLGRYLRKRESRLEAYHPVPEVLGQSRERADAFQRFWNQFVSPGEILFTRSGKGKDLLMAHRGAATAFSAETVEVWR